MAAGRRRRGALPAALAFLCLPLAILAHARRSTQEDTERSLTLLHAVAHNASGVVCSAQPYGQLRAGLRTRRWRTARARADLAALVFRQLGRSRPLGNDILQAISKSLVLGGATPAERAVASRVLVLSAEGRVTAAAAWQRRSQGTEAEPEQVSVPEVDKPASADYPWYVSAQDSDEVHSSKYMPGETDYSVPGRWSYPYYSCEMRRWLLSYTVGTGLTENGQKGVISLDIDVSGLEINQCDAAAEDDLENQVASFHGTHKCPNLTTQCEYRPTRGPGYQAHAGWVRGAYTCRCRRGFYSTIYPDGFNGSLVEVAYQDSKERGATSWADAFECRACQPGCDTCRGPEPCLATYNWPFRISLLVFSVSCAVLTAALAVYTHRHRRAKVFWVASPVFLAITLLGCAIMYLEMAAIFPVLDRYSCIATKWTRHMGFCITYTALLMKTWRVSLTYRVKSAHKLKLTDKQLLQWMAPVVLIMLVYLGTWTLSSPPDAEDITDHRGLKFKQCTYNWWDHSLAIGEILFLLWGVRVCYRVRHAESLYNEAKLISFAIYNIATVNSLMIAFHLLILPRAGPDIKYLLGFIRTQLSTSTTVFLVFAPKVIRVLRGNGDTWDSRARARGVVSSSSLNGIGLVPDEPPDLYTENEELKEEIQKLAGQIEFMKIVQMEMNNRHLKPRPGGYFSGPPPVPQSLCPPQSPQARINSTQTTEWSGPV